MRENYCWQNLFDIKDLSLEGQSYGLMSEKRKKYTRKLPKMRKCSILHYALVKNVSQLRFSRVLLAFFSRISRVCAHKHYQKANQTHGVIWALEFAFIVFFFLFCTDLTECNYI